MGCEAVHASCVGLPTAGQRLRAALAQIEPRVAALEATQIALQGEAARTLMEMTRAKADLGRAIVERDAALTTLGEVRLQRDTAVRERDAARTELATSRNKSQPPTQETNPEDGRTAAEIRFSLLELD